MGENAFLVGDYPTYIDFYFFEIVQLIKMLSDGAVMKEFPALVGYCQRFMELKGVKEYVSDPFCPEIDKLFNAPPPMGKINGKVGYK